MASEESVESPAGYRATFKAGDDYGAPWLNVWDTNVEDFDAKLEALTEGDTLKLVAVIGARLGNLFVEEVKSLKPEKAAKVPAQRKSRDDEDEEEEEEERPSRRQSSSRSSRGGSRTSSRSGGGSSRRSSRSDDYDQGEEHPDGTECDKCGEVLVYKSGVSGAGNNYALWTCPKQKRKGDGHDSEFIN